MLILLRWMYCSEQDCWQVLLGNKSFLSLSLSLLIGYFLSEINFHMLTRECVSHLVYFSSPLRMYNYSIFELAVSNFKKHTYAPVFVLLFQSTVWRYLTFFNSIAKTFCMCFVLDIAVLKCYPNVTPSVPIVKNHQTLVT